MNFKNANASAIGSSHHKLYYNNQDSCNFYEDKFCIIGVVADGCGSGSNSEVGARLGVDFVVNFCKKHFQTNPFNVKLLENALIEYLRNIVKNQQTIEEEDFIANYLYFTLFGFIIQPHQTFIFHSGDGLYLLNDKEVVIEQNNRPRYIAKNLVSGQTSIETECIETNNLQRLLVATDGLIHLNDKFLTGEIVEGMKKTTDFFDNEDYFDNIVSLPKFLTNLSVKSNILKDDTTLIMVKR